MRLPRTVGVLAVAAATLALSALSVPAAAAVPDQGGPQAPDRVLVKFSPTTTASTVADAVHAVGATEIGVVADLAVHVLSVPTGRVDQVLAALSRRGDVEYAEQDGLDAVTLTPNDPSWGQEWGLPKVNAPTAWNTTTGSSSMVVAILDTGVDFTHPDLQGRFVAGYDFVNGDSDPTDDNGHGTGTAGVFGATSNNGVGIAGTCWACKVMPVKVMNSAGSGAWSTIASGMTWATDHGAKIISMSLGGSTGSATMQDAVTYAQAHDVLVVAAAGNNASSALFYPAAYAGVLSVAGTQSNDTLYSWSDYGSWVSVAAPGCDYTTMRGGGYGAFCGTSAATPVVAGVAGLARSLMPAATGVQIATAIETSAVHIGSVVAYGRVDAAATLAATGSITPSPPPPSTTTTMFSGSLTPKSTSRSYSVASGTGQLQLGLTFTKVSTLTLTVRNASGQTVLQTSGPSPLRASASVSAGSYTLTVSGSNRSSFTLTVTCPTP
jgi:thermitase